MCLAGIWDRAVVADVGELQSFTVITQPAGSPSNAYHDRAPVVVPHEQRCLIGWAWRIDRRRPRSPRTVEIH